MRTKTFFLDMDGVLVDLVPRVLEAYDVPYQYREWPPDCYGLYDVCKRLKPTFDVPSDEFWTRFSSDWWWQLPKTSHCDEIVQKALQLAGLYRVHFCTFAITPESAEGKQRWVETHYPGMADRLIIMKHKWLLAKPGHILVDDRCASCKVFRKEGGEAVVVPRPWNELSTFKDHWVDMTLRQMEVVYNGE